MRKMMLAAAAALTLVGTTASQAIKIKFDGTAFVTSGSEAFDPAVQPPIDLVGRLFTISFTTSVNNITGATSTSSSVGLPGGPIPIGAFPILTGASDDSDPFDSAFTSFNPGHISLSLDPDLIGLDSSASLKLEIDLAPFSKNRYVATGLTGSFDYFLNQFGPDGSDRAGNLQLGAFRGTRYFGDVFVTDVPEPASWAMLISGFGAVGGALRRRRAAVPA